MTIGEQRDQRLLDDLVLTDVCPHTLGVAVSKEFGNRLEHGYFMPIIHRNTTIPVSREESVSTIEDGQTEIRVRVFQGESRKVDDNLPLGELKVDGLPAGPRGLEVVLRFTYDMNGLLEVEAIVPSTGKRYRTVLQQTVSNLSEEEIERAVAKMQELKVYPREDQENQRLLAFANAAVQEVDPFSRGDLEEAVDAYERWFHDNEREPFEVARQHLLVTLSRLGVPYEGGDA